MAGGGKHYMDGTTPGDIPKNIGRESQRRLQLNSSPNIETCICVKACVRSPVYVCAGMHMRVYVCVDMRTSMRMCTYFVN